MRPCPRKSRTWLTLGTRSRRAGSRSPFVGETSIRSTSDGRLVISVRRLLPGPPSQPKRLRRGRLGRPSWRFDRNRFVEAITNLCLPHRELTDIPLLRDSPVVLSTCPTGLGDSSVVTTPTPRLRRWSGQESYRPAATCPARHAWSWLLTQLRGHPREPVQKRPHERCHRPEATPERSVGSIRRIGHVSFNREGQEVPNTLRIDLTSMDQLKH